MICERFSGMVHHHKQKQEQVSRASRTPRLSTVHISIMHSCETMSTGPRPMSCLGELHYYKSKRPPNLLLCVVQGA